MLGRDKPKLNWVDLVGLVELNPNILIKFQIVNEIIRDQFIICVKYLEINFQYIIF